MKAVLTILAIVAVVVVLGWVTFSMSDGRPTATVQPDVIREDTRSAVESGERLVDEVRRTDVDVDIHREPAGSGE